MAVVLPFVRKYAWRGRAITLVGTGVYAHRELTDGEKDYISDAFALGTLGVVGANFIAAGFGHAVKGAVTTKTITAALKVLKKASPTAIGYAVGAGAGIAIAEAALGEGEMAYDLYTNPDVLSEGGIVYETADILGNASIIVEHYADAGHFSAAGKESGTNTEWGSANPYSRYNPFTGNENPYYIGGPEY